MMKHTHNICLLLSITREWLANRDSWKVLTKIHLSKSIQVTGHTHIHHYIERRHMCLKIRLFSQNYPKRSVIRDFSKLMN